MLHITPLKVGIAAALVAFLIVVDAVFGPLFPDATYCAVGAGTTYRVSASVKPGGWTLCAPFSSSTCVSRWVVSPATENCVHGTFWDAIESAGNNYA